MNVLYPPLCLDCGKRVENRQVVFCLSCQEQLELIEPKGRCVFCFSEGKSPCDGCKNKNFFSLKKSAAFEAIGPGRTLISELKFGNLPYLAKGASAAMATQILQMDWPLPDLIIPEPIPFPQIWERGYNQNLLLAEGIASILKITILDCLTQSLNSALEEVIRLKKKGGIRDKTALLVTDTLSSQDTLCAKALLEEGARRIYCVGCII